MSYWEWVLEHRQTVYDGVLLLVAVATFIVRLTPTQTDDGFMARVDKYVQKVLDWIKVPNKLK